MKAPSLRDVRRALPPTLAPLLEAVLEAARDLRLRAYLVGGPVRDLLLERPLRDLDLVVEGHQGLGAPELAKAVRGVDVRIRTHDRFGTVRMEHEGAVLDLTTARAETYAHPGALPSVAPGSLEDDLRRRDFTVNALALPLSAAARQASPDLVVLDDALEDLANRVLRVFHTSSFHDDPTRALRAARLSERLGFSVSRGSRTALRDALRDGAFGRVSGDRLRREFEKLFEDADQGLDPAAAMRRLSEWHVLGALEPGLVLRREAISATRRLGRAIREVPWPRTRFHPWVAGFAVWLAPLDSGLRRRTLRRLAVRGDRADRIATFAPDGARWLRALAKARGRGAIDRILAPVDEDRLMALAAIASPAIRRRIVRYAVEDRPRRVPVSGAELVALGLAGPAVGRALERIRVAYLDGAVRSRDEAMALAQEFARRRGASTPRRKAPRKSRS